MPQSFNNLCNFISLKAKNRLGFPDHPLNSFQELQYLSLAENKFFYAHARIFSFVNLIELDQS